MVNYHLVVVSSLDPGSFSVLLESSGPDSQKLKGIFVFLLFVDIVNSMAVIIQQQKKIMYVGLN